MTSSKVALSPDVVKALDEFANLQGVERRDIIAQILRDWLAAMNALPYQDLEEDTETAGEA
jgi:predicted transcriptional regulator